MANSFILSLMFTLVIEFVMTDPLMNYDSLDHAGLSSQHESLDNLSNESTSSSKMLQDTVGTRETGTFGGIVLFEQFLAEAKANLLSSSLYLEDHEDDMQSRFNDNPRTSSKCLSHISYVIEAAKRKLPWALDMIDSTGKPSSGVLQENYLFVGHFDQCIDVDTGLDFQGQYCRARLWITKIRNTTLTPQLQFSLGFCFPSSCDTEDFETYINSYFQSNLNISAMAQRPNCQERHLSLTTKAKWIICICSIFVMLVVIGTLYDVAYKRWWSEEERHQNTSNDQNSHMAIGSTSLGSDKSHSEHEPIIDPKLQKPKLYSNNETAKQEKSPTFRDTCDQFLRSFSVYTNTAKLFAINQSGDSIDCIHGIKFISMTWIILLHTHVMSSGTLENVSPYVDKANDDWTFMPVFKSTNAVDTFFALSGLLLTFGVLKKLTKEGVTPKFIGVFYLHRYLRLTSPYMLILMTYVPLFKYLSDGPFWPQDGIEIDECEDTWWTNLLYLNNFVKTSKMCMTWSWYLACDMQFYLVSPLMFLPLFFFEWKGLIVPFAFLLGNAICSGVISNSKDLIAIDGFVSMSGMTPGMDDYFKYYYMKPYTRIGPFIIGMVTGFLLFKFECKARLSKLAVVLGWMAATAMALAVVYGLYDHVRYDDRQSTEVRALYNALQRIAWGISVCWVIFACVNGYGGFVDTLLSWKALIPLSRLTYCAYLVHPLVIKFYFYSQRKPIYINDLNLTFVFVAAVVMSYAVAYIAYMVYEVPLTGLEKIVRGRGKRK